MVDMHKSQLLIYGHKVYIDHFIQVLLIKKKKNQSGLNIAVLRDYSLLSIFITVPRNAAELNRLCPYKAHFFAFDCIMD